MNSEQALECVRLGEEALFKGETEKAERLLCKAERLSGDASKEGCKKLRVKIEKAKAAQSNRSDHIPSCMNNYNESQSF